MVSISFAHRAEKSDSKPADTRAAENRAKFLTFGAIAATVLLWASAFPAIRVALQAYTPIELALWRYINVGT